MKLQHVLTMENGTKEKGCSRALVNKALDRQGRGFTSDGCHSPFIQANNPLQGQTPKSHEGHVEHHFIFLLWSMAGCNTSIATGRRASTKLSHRVLISCEATSLTESGAYSRINLQYGNIMRTNIAATRHIPPKYTNLCDRRRQCQRRVKGRNPPHVSYFSGGKMVAMDTGGV